MNIYRRDAIIVLTILLLTILGLFAWIVEANTAQQTNYTWFYEARWLGYSTDVSPCTYGADVYADDYPIELAEADDNKYEYLIINWQDSTFTQVFTEDVVDYALTWNTFERGEDNHPHPISALEAFCDFE